MARRDDDDDDAMAGGEGKRSRAERREQSEARLAMEINTGKNKCDRDSEMCVLCLSIRCTQIFKSRDGHCTRRRVQQRVQRARAILAASS